MPKVYEIFQPIEQYAPCMSCGTSAAECYAHKSLASSCCSFCGESKSFTDMHVWIDPDEKVHHPIHYGGDTPYETIKVIHAWNLGFNLGSAVKYISRAGKKHPDKEIEDLEKAIWYLQDHIDYLRGNNNDN